MAAAKKAAEAAPIEENEASETPAEETIERVEPVRQPVHLSDRHGRLHPDDVQKAREEAGIAPQQRLIEHTAAGVLKGS